MCGVHFEGTHTCSRPLWTHVCLRSMPSEGGQMSPLQNVVHFLPESLSSLMRKKPKSGRLLIDTHTHTKCRTGATGASGSLFEGRRDSTAEGASEESGSLFEGRRRTSSKTERRRTSFHPFTLDSNSCSPSRTPRCTGALSTRKGSLSCRVS